MNTNNININKQKTKYFNNFQELKEYFQNNKNKITKVGKYPFPYAIITE